MVCWDRSCFIDALDSNKDLEVLDATELLFGPILNMAGTFWVSSKACAWDDPTCGGCQSRSEGSDQKWFNCNDKTTSRVSLIPNFYPHSKGFWKELTHCHRHGRLTVGFWRNAFDRNTYNPWRTNLLYKP
jgi:hypothetical protein